MSSHVTSYKQQIEDLEAKASQQAAKIQQMEISEERLRATMRTNNRTSDGARISDLLDRLIETENSELKLKERVWNLEKKEKELQIKVNFVLVHQLLLWYQSHTRLAILLNQLRPCNNYSSADF